MARSPGILSPLGRFVGGACAMGGPDVVLAGIAGGAIGGPVGVGLLATLALFAGGVAFHRGKKAGATQAKTEQILDRLTVLMHEHRSLSRALALLPEGVSAGSPEIAHRIRTLRTTFADDDPSAVAIRLEETPDLAAFLEAQTKEREATDEQFRMGLNVLIDVAVKQGRFRQDALDALNGLGAKVDAILEGQHRFEAKIDDVVSLHTDFKAFMAESLDHLRRERFHETKERERIRNEMQVVYAEELARERDARISAERAAQALLDVRHVHGIEIALRRHGGQAIIDALLTLPVPTPDIRADIHRKVAQWAYLIGNIEQAERSLAILLKLDSTDVEALNQRGHVHRLLGELAQAEAAYHRVLELADEDRGWQAIANINLGNVLLTRGDLDGAEVMFGRALAIEEQLGRMEGMANAYGNLGIVLDTRGDHERAERMFHKALAIHQELNNQQGMAKAYTNLGIVLGTRRDLDGAENYHRKALAIHEQMGRTEGIANAFGNLGVVRRRKGDLREAEAMHRNALAFHEKMDNKLGMADNFGNLGIVLSARHDYDGAEAMYKMAQAIDEQLGRPEGIATASANLGLIAKQRGNLAEARRLWTLAHDLFAEIGAKPMTKQLQGWLDGLPPA